MTKDRTRALDPYRPMMNRMVRWLFVFHCVFGTFIGNSADAGLVDIENGSDSVLHAESGQNVQDGLRNGSTNPLTITSNNPTISSVPITATTPMNDRRFAIFDLDFGRDSLTSMSLLLLLLLAISGICALYYLLARRFAFMPLFGFRNRIASPNRFDACGRESGDGSPSIDFREALRKHREGLDEILESIKTISTRQEETHKRIFDLEREIGAMRQLSNEDRQRLSVLGESQRAQERRLDEIHPELNELKQRVLALGPLGAQFVSDRQADPAGRSPNDASRTPELQPAGDVAPANAATFDAANPESTGSESFSETTGKRLKEALLGCQGVNKPVLEHEFDHYYRQPNDLEKMMRRLLDMWLSRSGLPKSVYENISDRIKDKTAGKGHFALPEIRSRYDETRHDVLNYIALPSGASGEITKVFKPGIVIDGKQITRALVEVSQ